MNSVQFTQMKDGTREEYEFLDRLESEFNQKLPERILAALAELQHSLSGYRVSRLQHSLQTAARAEADGADEDMIVAALIHDIGDELAPYNHSQLAAAVIRPYVRSEVTWVLHHHGLFQNFYYAHHFGGDRHERDRYQDHPAYQLCVDFCEKWDQASFDPAYPTPDLEYFRPMVRRVFGRRPFDPAVLGEEYSLS
ncbi:HD domain-containing protein [Pseudomonas lalucatii]|uniref:HD domain-containing protein n=1 Tax=Pseudomonas lalucatii TaxID=1424203 RepID=A0ABS5Q398_9PSED|nr:HD domain-containing protein [Pseudomonas lalucatii]MBS7663231.1 HD domain-containing protein [Pseudomonas lalucatii]MBS7689946.1 HD domain-containing protein [Pseudomonas lalucatii]MBS7724902.1 HD domain-containing protein [Pseudomonas lalucatii]QVM87123.1 HD domain-containing protein [Pseudomonas lalucatii]